MPGIRIPGCTASTTFAGFTDDLPIVHAGTLKAQVTRCLFRKDIAAKAPKPSTSEAEGSGTAAAVRLKLS